MGPASGSALQEPTLVLNKSWVPINTTTVRHALLLVIKGAARFIQPETFEIHDFDSWSALNQDQGAGLRGVRLSLRIPEVIVLTQYNRVPEKSVPFSRRNLCRRDGNRCQYCGAQVNARDMTVDHVVPRSRGGNNSWENCVVACRRCNTRKGNTPLEVTGMSLLRAPRRPEWSPCLSIKRGQRKSSWKRFVAERHWRGGL
ncbi:MAG: HNH endonuclease [Planctomycetes bacterium]|nr:HNH endonuclease [Planctomycetota bacterium]